MPACKSRHPGPAHRKRASCLHCGQHRLIQARGLCHPCWKQYRDDYPVQHLHIPWTMKELNWLRASYQALGATACAQRLGRSKGSVVMQAITYGLTRPRSFYRESEPRLRQLHAQGLSDPEIARRLGAPWDRDKVRHQRRRLGLAPNRGSGGTRADGLASFRRTCRAHQVRSLVEVRLDVAQLEIAETRGWLMTRTHREADVLDQLETGPKTAHELVLALFDGFTKWRYRSMHTIARRLAARGLVRCERVKDAKGLHVLYHLVLRRCPVGEPGRQIHDNKD